MNFPVSQEVLISSRGHLTRAYVFRSCAECLSASQVFDGFRPGVGGVVVRRIQLHD